MSANKLPKYTGNNHADSYNNTQTLYYVEDKSVLSESVYEIMQYIPNFDSSYEKYGLVLMKS